MKRTISFILFLIISFHGCSASAGESPEPEKGKNNKEGQWFFIHMTDPQLGFIDANNSFTADAALFSRAIEIVNRLKPDFVVITGDFVNSSRNEGQLAEFKRLLRKFDKKIPVHIIPGNHDISNANNQASVETYIKNYGYDRFSFRHKGCTFVGINSCLIVDENEMLESDQKKWLEKQLKKGESDNFRFVFMHHSLFLKTPDEADKYSNVQTPKRREYLRLFEQYNVDAVMAGHLHDNSYGKSGDMEMITIGAVGKAMGKGYHGMSVVKVGPEGYSQQYIALDKFPESIDLD